MSYNLTEGQIEDILKEGRFDKEKYARYMSLESFNCEDLIEWYGESNIIPLIKDKNKLYEMLVNRSIFSDSTYDGIYEDIDYVIKETLKEITEMIDEGEMI